MSVHDNVGQKSVELEFWIFASYFLWIFNYKNNVSIKENYKNSARISAKADFDITWS